MSGYGNISYIRFQFRMIQNKDMLYSNLFPTFLLNMLWRSSNKIRKDWNSIKHISFCSRQIVLIYTLSRPTKQINVFIFISQTLMWVTRFLVVLLWGGQPGDQTISLLNHLFIYLFIYGLFEEAISSEYIV
jgi:hypothetical protein